MIILKQSCCQNIKKWRQRYILSEHDFRKKLGVGVIGILQKRKISVNFREIVFTEKVFCKCFHNFQTFGIWCEIGPKVLNHKMRNKTFAGPSKCSDINTDIFSEN